MRLALEHRTVMIRLPEADRADLDPRSTAAGVSVPQYVRTQCGFSLRWASNPKTEGRDREEDDAWERLKRLGLEPQEYFPPEG